MICVECKNPNVTSAFSRYKGNYIKLDVCSECNHVVDKYIEYDNVLLFIDLMLLKPQAYRHFCFNYIESEMIKDPAVSLRKSQQENTQNTKWSKYAIIGRFLVLIVLFEVYLLWAYEEKKSHHTLVMDFVLQQESYLQYGLFLLKISLDHLSFNFMIQLIFFKALGWDKLYNPNIANTYQKLYHSIVLLMDILVANSVRLLPILMLIWPYDRSLETSKIVFGISTLNVIESLKIISNVGYIKIIMTYIACKIFQEALSTSLLCGIISGSSIYSFTTLFYDYYQDIISLVYISKIPLQQS